MKPLNPIMAVLVIASVGATPLRTLAADGDNATPATAPASHPVDALAAILKENAAARKAAGDRIADFVVKGSGGKTFLGKGTNSSVLATNVREWADKTNQAGDVAMVYFVLGPGATVPGWASKSFASAPKHALWESRLVAGLAKYTEGDGQIQKDMEQAQLTDFLIQAVKAATTVFSDARDKKEVDLSVAANDNTGVVTPDTRNRAGAGSRLDGPTRGFTMDDLYGDAKNGGGAVVMNVAGPNDANSRTISMKIYTKRLPTGEVINEIGIFDITDKNDIFGQRFPLTSGNQKFALDDRSPGHKNYELSFGVADKDGNRTIKFARPGGGTAIETSVSDLYMKRADQAANVSSIVNVGGRDFYVLPQGGAKSALMMFPKEMIDNRQGTADARSLKPSLFAYVGQRGAEGVDEIIPNPPGSKGGPMLGMVGDKPYRLEFNKTLGIWEAKPGEGDLPPAPPKPAPAGGATTPAGDGTTDNTDPGNNTGGNTGGNTGADTGAGQPVPDLEAFLLATPVDGRNKGCKKFPADNAELAANLRGNYSIVTCENELGIKPIILVPKTDKTPIQQLSFPNVRRARFFDHYVVLQFDTQAQYLDLLKPNGTGFDRVGFVDVKARNASDFTEMPIFIDALKNFMGISETSADRGAFTAVPERMKNAVGSKAFSMTGMIADGNLVVTALSGGNTFMVWPKNQPPGGEVPQTPTEPYAGVSGTSNAMDGTIMGQDADFKESFETPDHYKATLMPAYKNDANDVALYDAVDLTGKDKAKRYFMEFKYRGTSGNEEKVYRQKPFEIFNSTNPLPGGLKVQGLTKTGSVVRSNVQTGYRFISKSTKDKGVLAVFQNRSVSGDNVREKKDNCVGPIAYWGVDAAAAMKACEEDKL